MDVTTWLVQGVAMNFAGYVNANTLPITMVIGIIYLVAPVSIVHMNLGMQNQNAEPSEYPIRRTCTMVLLLLISPIIVLLGTRFLILWGVILGGFLGPMFIYINCVSRT